MAVDRRDGDGVPQTQVVELVEVRVYVAGGVHFVHRQDDGLAAPLEHPRHLLVGGGEARFDIGQEYDHVRVADGDLRLLAHER